MSEPTVTVKWQKTYESVTVVLSNEQAEAIMAIQGGIIGPEQDLSLTVVTLGRNSREMEEARDNIRVVGNAIRKALGRV